MAVSVKMGVDIGGFKSGIKEGQQILKSLDAEMKVAEAEFKATGNAENMLAQKTKTLTSQLNIQKSIMEQAQSAMKAMTDAGIKPTDAAYQKLNVQMLNAQAGMLQAQAALNGLDGSQQEAAASADALSQSMNSIGKKISLDQVISGIDRITGGLEKAAKKAVELGQDIWNSIMDSAKWADDTATMAQMYGIDVETFQRMQKLVAGGLDTTVEAVLKSQSKLKKGIGAESKEVMADLEALGLAFTQTGKNGETFSQLVTEDSVDLFFRAGQALMNLGDEFKQEDMAQRLFGKSWHELVPLFSEYKTVEEYNKALEEQRVTSEEDVDALVALNDKVGELKSNFDTLKNDVMASLAPALTSAADALNGLLTSVLDYLKTEEGQQALDNLSKAVSGLFDDLGKIDPEQVVEGFTGVFNTVVDSIKWVSDNWEGVVTALESIVIGWGALEITGGILDIVKIVQGIGGLTGTAAAAAGTAAGSAWGGSFASAVMAAAPWLIGLYTLLNPAGTAGDNLDSLQNPDGTLTEAGQEAANRQQMVEQAAQEAWDLYRTNQLDQAAIENLREKVLNDSDFNDLINRFMEFRTENGEGWKNIEDIDLTEWLKGIEPPVVEIDPVAPEGAAADIAAQVGTVELPVVFVESSGERIKVPDRRTRMGGPLPGEHANGLWSVPFDGYLARLHRGEQVVPAREVQNRSYNSNLYVESMYMNNGQDAEGLAAAMAAANRRTMSGFGC